MPKVQFADWDIRTYERAAFAALRGLHVPRKDWGECIGAAERVLAEAEEVPESETEGLFAGDLAVSIIAASRILDSASRPESGLSESDRNLLAIEASTAYALSGNFPSAFAVLRDLRGEGTDLLRTYLAVLAFSSPELALSFSPEGLEPSVAELTNSISTYLTSGIDGAFATAREAWRRIVLGASGFPHLSAAMRAGRVALFQLHTLSVVRNLAPFAQHFPRNYINDLIGDKKWILLPSQYLALRAGILEREGNVICAFPTSTGKTLLGEFCLAKALGERPGLVAFVSPYQAVARQVFRAIREHIRRPVHTELLMGGYEAVEELEPSARPTFIVATPERFDAMLRGNRSHLEHLRAVVFDEAHIVEQPGRGPRVEGLVSRLRLRQRPDGTPRIILLSAAITGDSLERFRQWVGAPTELSLDFDWRPTARRLAVWEQPGRLAYYGVGDPVTSEVEASRTIGFRTLAWPYRGIPTTDKYPQILKNQPLLYRNVVQLCKSLHLEHRQPILSICATKAGTRQLAMELRREFPDLEPLPPNVTRVVETISRRYPHLTSLKTTLFGGIAYHNASLPAEVRAGIEDAVHAKELAVVCATTTLAEGVDLPFRFTILMDWLTWQDGTRIPISGLLFRNIAGRCGRAWHYTEGDTIILDNPLGFWGHPSLRLDEIHHQLIDPASARLESSLALLGRSGTPQGTQKKIEALVESQYIAAINENPGEDALQQRLAQSLMVSVRGIPDSVSSIIHGIEEGLLSEDRPVAVAASPLVLTEFGTACLTTGLSGSSCRKLADWIEMGARPADVNQMLAGLFEVSSSLPEASPEVMKVYKPRSKSPVKPGDVASFIGTWIAGNRPETIFPYLPAVQRSKRQPELRVWLQGWPQGSSWDDYHEDFVDFIFAGIQMHLAWIVRAVGRLETVLGGPAAGIDWMRIAEELEEGVDSRWALSVLDAECPAPRWVVAPFGRALEEAASGALAADGAQVTPDALLTTPGIFERIMAEAIEDARMIIPPAEEEFADLRRWLRERGRTP